MFSRSFPAIDRPGAAGFSALAAVFAAATLAMPGFVFAQAAATAPTPGPQAMTHTRHHHHRHYGMAAHGSGMAHETVDARISTLHTRLAITADEETKWAAVAQVMRDNEAGMQRLVAERRGADVHDVTAVEDLKTYEQFTQAHVDSLKTLIASFEILYSAMPAEQQAVADHVFAHFANRAHTLHS